MARPFPWKAALPLLASAIYGVSPIDLIPDLIPLLGWSDDAALGILALIWAIRIVRKHIARRQASKMSAWPDSSALPATSITAKPR